MDRRGDSSSGAGIRRVVEKETPSLDQLERQVQTEIQHYQLDGYLDSAKKAEFKGQKKKALDQYYEALYLLRHDEVDDSLQKEQITFIETRISELGGSLD